jgi:anti-anti-sigma factor
MSSFHISDELPAGPVDGGDHIVLVVASGEIDYGASPRLRERIFDHIDAGRRRLVVDLSMVSFIDSAAIGVLTGAIARLRALGGGALVVACAEENARVLRIFDIAGVASLIPLYYTREEALATLAAACRADRPAWLEQPAGRSAVEEPYAAGRPSPRGALRKYAQHTDVPPGSERTATGRNDPQHEVDELA